MTPEEMTARLASLDDQLGAKLRHLGFSEAELAAVMDRSTPEEQRRRLIDAALTRAAARQLADPSSPLHQATLDQTATRLTALPEVEAGLARERRGRRRGWLLLVGVSVLAAGGVGAWLALRPPNPCVATLGPLAELERLAGHRLVADRPIGPFGRSARCSLHVWAQDRDTGGPGNPLVIVENDATPSGSLSDLRDDLERKAFARSEKLALADEGWLYVAGDATATPPAEVLRRAVAGARQGARDPMGAALASLPPAHHVVLLRRGEAVTTLKLERRVFTPELAKTVAAKLAPRVGVR